MRKFIEPIQAALEKFRTIAKENNFEEKSNELEFKLLVDPKHKKLQHAKKIEIPLNKY